MLSSIYFPAQAEVSAKSVVFSRNDAFRLLRTRTVLLFTRNDVIAESQQLLRAPFAGGNDLLLTGRMVIHPAGFIYPSKKTAPATGYYLATSGTKTYEGEYQWVIELLVPSRAFDQFVGFFVFQNLSKASINLLRNPIA